MNKLERNNIKLKNYKRYFIEFNGGYPYLVYYNDNEVYI